MFHWSHAGRSWGIASDCSHSAAQPAPLPCDCTFARSALPFLPFSSSRSVIFFFLLLVPVNPSAAIRLFPRPPERKGCIIEQEAVEGSDSPLTPSTIALTLSESQTEWGEEILHILMERANCWWALPLRDFPQTSFFFAVWLADLGIISPVQTKRDGRPWKTFNSSQIPFLFFHFNVMGSHA